MLATLRAQWAYVTEKKAYKGQGRGRLVHLRTPQIARRSQTCKIKRLTQSNCHVVGRTVTGIPDQLSFLIASAD